VFEQLENPHKKWVSDDLIGKRLLLKIIFEEENRLMT